MSGKYALIAAEKATVGSPYPVRLMCRWLSVSTAGFYEWLTAAPSARSLRREKVAGAVSAAFTAGRGTYGVRRVRAALARSADPEIACASEHLVRSIMAERGLRACQPRAYKTTTVRGPNPVTPIADHVRREFTAAEPGTRLVGDITYIRTWQGWLYLATVIDLHSKEVIGWSMADHMRTELVCDALSMAAARTEFAPGVVFHSDRGTQYTSAQFAAHLAELDVTGSMGRTGVCWDNALAESFFAAIKNELIYRTAFPTRDKARTAIADYIEVFYAHGGRASATRRIRPVPRSTARPVTKVSQPAWVRPDVPPCALTYMPRSATLPAGAVARTFDDGPNPTWTPQIPAILARFQAHATFFDIGVHVAEYPSTVRAEYAAGTGSATTPGSTPT